MAQNNQSEAPLSVKILSWLGLISGIFALFGTLPFLLLGGLGKSEPLFLLGLISLVRGVGFVVLSFGLRKMRRWALYGYTVVAVLGILATAYSFFTNPNPSVQIKDFASAIIEALVLLYLWSISKKFT